jgi:hypothetical protein
VINGYLSTGMHSAIGDGTSDQWGHCNAVSEADAQPGDLVFERGPEAESNNHVGIICGKTDAGDWIVIHCSAWQNGVTVGEAYNAGFRLIRQPAFYPSQSEVESLFAQNQVEVPVVQTTEEEEPEASEEVKEETPKSEEKEPEATEEVKEETPKSEEKEPEDTETVKKETSKSEEQEPEDTETVKEETPKSEEKEPEDTETVKEEISKSEKQEPEDTETVKEETPKSEEKEPDDSETRKEKEQEPDEEEESEPELPEVAEIAEEYEFVVENSSETSDDEFEADPYVLRLETSVNEQKDTQEHMDIDEFFIGPLFPDEILVFGPQYETDTVFFGPILPEEIRLESAEKDLAGEFTRR